MKDAYIHRTKLLVGEDNIKKLEESRVILFGVGGVGSWCAEGLIRSGIGNLTIVDSDCVCATNINRQLQATSDSIGKVKVDELKKRLLAINPDANIDAQQRIYSPESCESFKLPTYNYIVDAIDSLSNKKHLIETALLQSIPLFASMGAALKLDPTKIKVDSIWKTKGCPLAREVRRHLRKEKISKKFDCVYSEEILTMSKGDSFSESDVCVCSSADTPGNPELENHKWCSQKTQVNGSIAHITAIFGFMLAGLVIEDIVNVNC